MNKLVTMYEERIIVLIRATISASFSFFPAFSPSAFAQSLQLTFLPVRESKTLARAGIPATYQLSPNATYYRL